MSADFIKWTSVSLELTNSNNSIRKKSVIKGSIPNKHKAHTEKLIKVVEEWLEWSRLKRQGIDVSNLLPLTEIDILNNEFFKVIPNPKDLAEFQHNEGQLKKIEGALWVLQNNNKITEKHECEKLGL